MTSIEAVTSKEEQVDVYNVAGMLVAKRVRADKVSKMQPGIYVIKGQKVSVK